MDENSIREEAKSLKIRNWHNKNIATLKQEVLDARVANEHSGKAPGTPVVNDDTPITTVQPAQPKTEAQIIKEEEIEGNKGFIEAAKEEGLYPFVNKKGDRIGLWRKVGTDYDIPPYEKDSSYKFIRWSDET